MNKLLVLIGLILTVALVTGCGASGDSGDVETARKASAAMPKTESDLPADMPEAAKRSAMGAIKQNEIQKQQMDAQADAMRRAQASRK